MPSYGKIEAFDEHSESWSHYYDRFELYFLANDIEDERKKRAIFLTTVGSQTFAMLQSLTAPTKVSDVPFATLIEYMNSHYCPRTSEIVERFKFNCRIRNSDESIATYIARLRRLAENCNFGATLDTMLRDRIVCGISDSQILKRLLAEPELTLAKTIEIATAMETAVKHSADLQTDSQHASVHVHSTTSHSVKTKPISDKLHFKQQVKPRDVSQHKTKSEPSSSHKCIRCGSPNHSANICPFLHAKCNSCKKIGHVSKMCITSGNFVPNSKRKTQRNSTVHTMDDSVGELPEYTDIFQIGNGFPISCEPLRAVFTVNGLQIPMEIDSGAPHTLITKDTYENNRLMFPNISPSTVLLKSYTGDKVPVLGSLTVDVSLNQKQKKLQVIIVDTGTVNLCGRDWIREFNILTVSPELETHNMNQTDFNSGVTNSTLVALLNKHKKVFEDTLGMLKGTKVHLQRNETVTPKFFKARSVPYAYKDKVSRELDRMIAEGILTPVKSSAWAAPIVPVLKKDKNTIRICGDFKLTANKATVTEQYPLPRAEDLYAKLAGGQKFTKLDLRDAYNQLEVDDESSELLVINTEKGLFKYNRLPFGVSSASAIFQRELETLTKDVHSTCAFQDDLLVTGSNDDEHLHNLDLALQRIEDAGLKLRLRKCDFMKESVEYLGHRIDKHGIHPTQEKVRAISEAPRPQNADELRSFIGLITYYSKFIPKMSTTLTPLYKLLTKNTKWCWTHDHETAFRQAKNALMHENLLVHFDPSREIFLQCDASPFGLGAVLSHKEDSFDKPIAYASRTLTSAEKNYSQTEREALSLVFGVTRFRSYLLGNKFTLVTDHKPLTSIFSENKSIPQTAASRVQRWALTLAAYNYNIVYRPGMKHTNADALSRFPVPCNANDPPEPAETILVVEHFNNAHINTSQLVLETKKDSTSIQIMKYMHESWPNTIDETIRPYWNRRHELAVHKDLLCWNKRVIVPHSLRQDVLSELHSSHFGITFLKRTARTYVWWPGLDKDIENTVKSCVKCQQQAASPPKQPTQWPDDQVPWSRIHLDFFGPVNDHMILVLVNPHCNWIDAIPMRHATAASTVDELSLTFARFGLPSCIVTDNGSQFTGAEFDRFVSENGIKHITSPPYHPNSNGPAERAVRTIKEALRKSDPGSLKVRLSRILLAHHLTPTAANKSSPFDKVLKNKAKSRLDTIFTPKAERKTRDDAKLHPGTLVWIRNYSTTQKSKWINGIITRQLGNTIFEVRANNKLHKRHVDQLRLRVQFRDPTTVEADSELPWLDTFSGPATVIPVEESMPSFRPRRSERVRQPPNRLCYS